MGSLYTNLATIWDARRFLQPKVGTMHFFVAQENVDYRACEINFFEERKKKAYSSLYMSFRNIINPT